MMSKTEGKCLAIRQDITSDMFSSGIRENDGHTNNHEETMVTTSSLRALLTN